MRTIHSDMIKSAVADLCVEANCFLPADIKDAICNAAQNETGIPAEILKELQENFTIAEQEQMPVCQDTGMAVVFVRIGQDVHIEGDTIGQAIEEGVREGYKKGFLRCSVVEDPLRRVNTKDNTPPIIHYEMTAGDQIEITVAPKGFGSENMSALKMLKPSDGEEGVKNFVLETVQKAGSNPCPPIVVGIGIGGTMEKAAFLAKKALSRDLDHRNQDPFYRAMEEELLQKINALGIGPAGLGGGTTALGVNIETFPTHIAGLPVAVNISCHVTRHKSTII